MGGVALAFRGTSEDAVANRLEALARATSGGGGRGQKDQPSLLAGYTDDMPGLLEAAFSRITNIRLLLEQADVEMAPTNFVMIMLGLAGGSSAISVAARVPLVLVPLVALTLSSIPLFWLLYKRKARRAAFAKQLPEALELIARALRAGHSLASGFQLVGDEMADPIGKEFNRVFEEQNLGVPLEQALSAMSDRVPNLDLRFFATAVILQRQTGGDLAEILDKIGSLIRERFKIYGAIQALTGEGRLSGVVLLALPPVLFLVMLKLNYDYVMILFRDPMGTKLLVGALVLQLVGALVIRKIVNIKV